MAMAYNIQKWSKDPNRKVGCVIVSPDKRSISIGFNGLPKGIPDHIRFSLTREEKNSMSIHAERNAIDNYPTRMDGWTIYVTRFPCAQCAASIIQNGISRIVTTNLDPQSNWIKDMKTALNMFDRVNMEIMFVKESDFDE